MNVEIIVIAKDYEAGKQATRKEEVEVPGKTLKLFEMFNRGDPDGLLRWVADTIFGTALREVQGGGKSGNLSLAMEQSGAGRIGGREAPGSNKTADILGEQLGLDVIRRDVQKSRGQAPTAPQQQQGPGAVGFGGDRPINPGPGPGPVGFGPDRNK